MADLTVAAETCVALGATEHQFESFPGRDIALGALTVSARWRMSRFARTRVRPSPVPPVATSTIVRARSSARITWLGNNTRDAG